jgi:hypothetical protein
LLQLQAMLGKVGVVGAGPAVVACEDVVGGVLLVLMEPPLLVGWEVAVGHAVAPLTPTQYAWPTQKLTAQSALTAGFHARNWSREIPNLAAIVGQVLPDTMV